MTEMAIHAGEVEVPMETGMDIRDITGPLRKIIDQSGIVDGQASVSLVGSTGSVTTIEYEPGVVADLKAAIDRLAPPDAHYAHEEAWHDGNGHSHVQAALLGPSVVVAVRNGKPALGTWQQVVLINHDNRPRRRRAAVTVIGTRSG